MKRAIPFFVLLLLVGAIVAKVLFFEFPKIGGNDMAPVVQRGDWLLAYKGDQAPRRGQLVVVDHPHKNTVLVRRVVGLPGETVVVNKETPTVDGKRAVRKVLRAVELTEGVDGAKERLRVKLIEETLGGATYTVIKDPRRRSVDTKPVRLGPGQFYVLADHRNHGTDSRTFGPVSLDRIRAVVTHRLVAGDGCVKLQREGLTRLP